MISSKGGGNKYVNGGLGVDNITGGSGSELLFGGAGDDVINVLNGNDRIFGGTDTLENVTAFLSANFVTISIAYSGITNTSLTGSGVVAEGAFRDITLTNAGNDYLDGSEGNHYIDGRMGMTG